MQWASGIDGGPSQTVDEVLRSTGALLVGRRTQDVEDRLQPGFYRGAFRGPFFVLRHDPPRDPPVVKGVTGQFIDAGIGEAVTLAKEAADGGDVVVLGANVARQCLEAGLLDEVIVHVAPVLVGDGVRLFDRAGGAAVKLTPISSADEGGMTVLRYALGQAGPGGLTCEHLQETGRADSRTGLRPILGSVPRIRQRKCFGGAGREAPAGPTLVPYRLICRPALAEIVGDGRPWTVLMISLLSMPWR
jgi:dihydrofolate reductase